MNSRFWTCLLAASMLLAALAAPQDAGDAMVELAAKTIRILGTPSPIEIAFRSLAPAREPDLAPARSVFERELKRAGFTVASPAPVEVLVTLSENVDSRIWAAEVRRPGKRDVVLVSRKRPAADDRPRLGLPVEIRRRLILDKSEPILDLAPAGDDFVVLGPAAIAVVGRSSQGWETKQEVSLPEMPAARSRDVRGRLSQRPDGFTAYLPGASCDIAVEPNLQARCEPAERDWPLGPANVRLAPARNFFVRGSAVPFFSAAGMTVAGEPRWVCPGIDGRVRVLDNELHEVGQLNGLGSDVAAIANTCGTASALIASVPTGTPGQSTVQAFEIAGAQAVPISPPVDLPGILTALWPSDSSDTVLAITRNTQTGNHAAFHLFLSCGR